MVSQQALLCLKPRTELLYYRDTKVESDIEGEKGGGEGGKLREYGKTA